MRGLVMEVKEEILVVLTPQGKYIRMKNPGATAIGDFVPCNHAEAGWVHRVPRIDWVPRKVMAMAASLLLMCSAGLGAYGYSQPFGVVNIDINPSMALTYNWFEQVIAVEALNDDAEKLLPELEDIKHKPISEAVHQVVAAASQAGYLEPELANVVFISVSDKNSNDRTAEVINTIGQDLEKNAGKTETVLLKGTAQTYDHVKETHAAPTKELIESSLKDGPEDSLQIPSGKPLQRVLKEQEEKRNRDTNIKAPENSPGQENPENGKSRDKDDKDRPSKENDFRDHDRTPENTPERPQTKPDRDNKDKPWKDESDRNEDKKPDGQEHKPWDEDESRNKNKSDH